MHCLEVLRSRAYSTIMSHTHVRVKLITNPVYYQRVHFEASIRYFVVPGSWGMGTRVRLILDFSFEEEFILLYHLTIRAQPGVHRVTDSQRPRFLAIGRNKGSCLSIGVVLYICRILPEEEKKLDRYIIRCVRVLT